MKLIFKNFTPKIILRILIYLFFGTLFLQAFLEFLTSAEYSYPTLLIGSIILLIIIVGFIVGLSELFLWILYKILVKTEYFESKKNKKLPFSKKKETYKRGIKKYVVVMLIISVIGFIIYVLSIMGYFPEPIHSESLFWVEILILSLTSISLIGLFLLKKWIFNIYMSINIISLFFYTYIENFDIYFIAYYLLFLYIILYYPYVRREVFK